MNLPNPRLKEAPSGDFLDAARLSERALELAYRYRTPPNPQAYEVWFAYVKGENEELRERIDQEIENRGFLDLDTIEEIRRQHVTDTRQSAGVTGLGEELYAGLKDAIHVLREGLGPSQGWLDTLSRAPDRIWRGSQRGDARRAVAELAGLVRAHASQAKSLNSELSMARAQVEALEGGMQVLRDTAYLDYLTQIPNRRYLDEILEREIATAVTAGEPLSFTLGDLDHFKRLNDEHGHGVGDAVLKHVAELIKRNVKGQDTPARFGGEEFAIIFPRTSLHGAGTVTEKIRRQLNETNFVLSKNRAPVGRISASFGVTQLLPGDTAAELVHRADGLLYQAKQMGRNRVETGDI